eukprot:NODE_41_length_29768_cov_0.533924.p1 type:complete len:737 gc:universal NODE_41_length_29768_cov_0.533924:15842-13632(-)
MSRFTPYALPQCTDHDLQNRFSHYPLCKLMTNWHALHSHCQSSIQDFKSNSTDYSHFDNGVIVPNNLTIDHRDKSLHVKDCKNANLQTVFDSCQTNHKYIWLNIQVPSDCSFTVTTTDCKNNKFSHSISKTGNEWTTPSGKYTEGFLVKLETDILSFIIDESSVDEYSVDKFSFIDCPMPSTDDASDYTVGLSSHSTDNSTGPLHIHYGHKHGHGEPCDEYINSNITNSTGNGSAIYPAWKPTPTKTTSNVTDIHYGHKHGHGEPCNEYINSTTNGSAIYPAWSPPANNSAIYPAWTGSPSNVSIYPAWSPPAPKSKWTHYKQRIDVLDQCNSTLIDDFTTYKGDRFNRSLESMTYNNGSCNVTSKSSLAWSVPKLSPINLDIYKYAVIEYSADAGLAFTIKIESGDKWIKSRFSRIVVESVKSRTLLVDLQAYNVSELTGIKLSRFNIDGHITLTKVSLYKCDEAPITPWTPPSNVTSWTPPSNATSWTPPSNATSWTPPSNATTWTPPSNASTWRPANWTSYTTPLTWRAPTNTTTPNNTTTPTNDTLPCNTTAPKINEHGDEYYHDHHHYANKSYFVLNDFTGGDPNKNVRGYRMGCDSTSQSARLENGTLSLEATNQTYWYTNVGAPCLTESFVDYKQPGIEIELECEDSELEFDIQLEYAKDCSVDDKDRKDYKISSYKSKNVGKWDGKRFRVELDVGDELKSLFSIYILNIKVGKEIKMDHIHVVDINNK